VTPRETSAQRRARKEREYLEILERMRRDGAVTWPEHFAVEVLGFKSKKALNTYPKTKEAVQQYALKVAPHKMKGFTPALQESTERVEAADLAVLQSEVEARSREIDRLQHALDEATETLAREQEAHARTRHSLDIARAMVDELDDYIAHRSVPLAREIEERIHRAVAQITENPARHTAPTRAASAPSGTGLRLVLPEDEDDDPPPSGRKARRKKG
jgi:hypothetical protein